VISSASLIPQSSSIPRTQARQPPNSGIVATRAPLLVAVVTAIAAAGCGLAQGKAVVAACEGIARNPQAAGNIRTTMIIGLALIEALVIYVLVAAFAVK